MMSPEQIAKAQRRGFWAALICGALWLLGALAVPTAAIFALVFFAAAWGVRRGHAWAAIALGCFLVISAVVVFARGVAPLWDAVAGGLIDLALAWFLARAAVALWRQGGRSPWPWLPVAAGLLVFFVCFEPYIMPSASMEKTILVGDSLLVQTATWHLGREPRFGDMVVLHYPVDPRQVFIKRVVGLPGDRLRIRDKQLFRNGTAIAEPYAIHNTSYNDPYRDNFPSAPTSSLPAQGEEMLRNHVRGSEVIVPAGEYFVLGDNRDDSLDSRYWGFVKRSEIIGSPVLVYASNEVAGGTQTGPRTILNTRWNRLLRPL